MAITCPTKDDFEAQDANDDNILTLAENSEYFGTQK